jgi:Protein of unknown function (DUF3142)
MAVVRVETDRKQTPLLTDDQRRRLAASVAELGKLPNVRAVQIDFDASRSERSFYRDLIVNVKQSLPRNVGLSITALASWCSNDDWLSDLPIDEAVPMLFRMGPDRERFVRRIAEGREFTASRCQLSYGISTDEPVSGLSHAKRVYVFNPDAWSESSVRTVLDSRQ